MSLVFQPLEEEESVRPFDGFPFDIKLGSSLAVLFSEPLSQAVFLTYLEAALLEKGEVYHVSVGRTSAPPVNRLLDSTEGFYFARTTRFEDVLMASREVPTGSSLVVDGFPALLGISSEGLLELVDESGSKNITLILSHTPVVLNELDLPGEFQRNFLVPEVFDYLLAIRSASYRSHYKMGISALRLPLEWVSLVGEHTIPADSIVKRVL
ncbi:hypothetical protein [Thermococcus gorgonarius]|uniref:KaiC-like domain-containing protein n=1 Tax=Thermococcus gorgonarius TaxID=71997 RepID=A0A2Z2M5X9_THEGO|nr:hypothetical protein [Thermococcus gorgonarius]ASJ00509.1 hypothetical protein A3K92_02960 [Thermococcus gorgonarius]